MENLSDNDCLILVYDQVSHRLIFLIGAALVHQLVPVRQVASPVLAILDHLQVLCAHTDGGFFAFAGCLPEPDIVEQLVHVGVEALLPFAGAPDLDNKLAAPIVCETPAYYVVGTCGNGGWAADANAENEAYKMADNGDGTYSLKVSFTDTTWSRIRMNSTT